MTKYHTLPINVVSYQAPHSWGFLFVGCWVDFDKEIIMKKLWDKIPPQYQGYLVGIFLFLLVIWSMWSVWDKTSH